MSIGRHFRQHFVAYRKRVLMKPNRAAALLAFAFVALFLSGGAPKAGADTCRHTEVVFYTTDTTRLATELSKSASSCADYYLSITPNAGGVPRGGTPVTTIHSLGPRFHAMAEIRLNPWASYASAHGGTPEAWYATGVEVRKEMRDAGYDAALGDAWAINEVGAPSGTPMGVDVLKNNGSARDDLRAFVRGLYTGDDGLAERGLVFAADPLQVTSDLSQYAQDLASWYADSTFWTDLAPYVHFWAQETYADASAWGVAGSTLGERSAYLNDYFLHALRAAQRGDGSTAAARAFFASTYTPVGNAAFRWPPPNTTTGIGFGYTDIGLTGMLNFVSTQTYTLRSSTGDRFGFAVVPNNALAAQTIAVEDRLAAAIHDSESDPNGACGANFQLCDSAVAGAQFNGAWKVFANTLEGSSVEVQVAPDVSIRYAGVTARGSTWAETSPASATPPPRFQLLSGTSEYDLQTTASYTAPLDLCVAYDAEAFTGFEPHLFQFTATGWTDVTTSSDSSVVCGSTETLGTFVVFAADPTPAVITPHVDGPLGDNGWYVGDVTVTWNVVEPQSPSSVVTSGCDETSITADTKGTPVTCTATSDGGTASESVTIYRDATPPAITCLPTPSSLWPPTGKLVPVTVGVTVTDGTSGADGFLLTGAATSLGDLAQDVVDFDVGTPDVAGLLRAKRPGTGSERIYSLAYTARDLAGNTTRCVGTVAVPHDQGS
jgi:hypothetical protein